MKVFFINTVYNTGSTGRITAGLIQLLKESGDTGLAAYGYPGNRSDADTFCIQSKHHYYLHNLLSRLTGCEGCFSTRQTRQLIGKIREYDPDVIHLHNLHGHYLNLRVLFSFLREYGKPIVWTLHDCWAMTGHCPHYMMAGCDKWQTGCHHCSQLDMYPRTLVDNTQAMWHKKREWFTGVENMTIVTPSNWLGDQVKQSFLSEYPLKVIHNGIDLSVFRPTGSALRSQNGWDGKFLLLGVAFDWGIRKGLDVFCALAERLDDRFQIILVGTNEAIDRELPKNIYTVHRTENQRALAELYTAADLFINPTREEAFGLVNAEALACGTPVVTFQTGGSPEIPDESCGSIVPWGDVDALEQEIRRIADQHPYSQTACLERAISFDADNTLREYLHLYADITKPK